jgi:hypothetical protein
MVATLIKRRLEEWNMNCERLTAWYCQQELWGRGSVIGFFISRLSTISGLTSISLVYLYRKRDLLSAAAYV